MSLTTGQILDNKYRIVRIIGEGGMGAVYEGENTLIARRVAIKVLHGASKENEQAMARFEREAQAAGRIGSDHILEVLDLGSLEDGSRYMVMEYLDGEPLASRIEKAGRMRPEEIARLMAQALKGLQAAHDAGIIHRDLKPDNLYILKEKAGQKDFVKIIDFGISKFSVLGSDMNMTRTGAVMGTPYYMSPEQAKGSSQVDPRSDVYAIGVIMYEALTGRVPFDGDTFNELMFKIVLSEPPALTDVVPDIDPKFAKIVNTAMARELGERYSSADELRGVLEAYLAGRSIPAPAVQGGAAPGADAVAAHPGGSVQTAESWANTNAEMAVPKKSAAPAIATVLGILVLAGGAFGAYALVGSGGDAPDEAAAAASVEAVAVPPEPKAPEPAVKPVENPEPEAAATPEPEPEPEPSAEPEEKEPAPKKVAPAPRTKPRAARKPAPKPEPKAAPPPPKPAPKKKPARQDFGY